MTAPIDHQNLSPIAEIGLDSIADAILILENTKSDARFDMLKALCLDYGVWGIPDDTTNHCVAMYEVQLLGVPAIGDDPTQLPRNWISNAKSMIDGLSAQRAAQ
jgi:hypothetical protein